MWTGRSNRFFDISAKNMKLSIQDLVNVKKSVRQGFPNNVKGRGIGHFAGGMFLSSSGNLRMSDNDLLHLF